MRPAISAASSAVAAVPHSGARRPSSWRIVPNRSRSSATSIAAKGVPRIGTPASSRRRASRSGVWPPNITTTPIGPLAVDHLEDVLDRERLEVEAVGRLGVGRDGLGVAVHHDGVVAQLAERAHGLHAAVVELDALADAVGPGAEDDDRRALGLGELVLELVRGVEVRRLGLDLGRARVDRLVHRPHARRPPQPADGRPRRIRPAPRCGRRPCRAPSAGASRSRPGPRPASGAASARRGRRAPTRRRTRGGRPTRRQERPGPRRR